MKGQGALEYLMTYGWALLIIVVVGAALFALGVFSPQTRSTCTGFQYFVFKDHARAATTYSIIVINSNQDVEVTDLDIGTAGTTAFVNVSAGRQVTLNATSTPTKTSGDSFSDTVTITYNVPGLTGKKDSAVCNGKVV